MIKKIYFKNYKSFKEKQELEFKPITILIGKNSSGKSAIAKLPTLLDVSLKGKYDEAVLFCNKNVELGAEFRDLLYGRLMGSLEFAIESDDEFLELEITSNTDYKDLPIIRNWSLNKTLTLAYSSHQNIYIDQDKFQHTDIEFKGFKIVNNSTFKFNLDINSNYIGPFREIPKRTYRIYHKSIDMLAGIKGENTYQILIHDFVYNKGELLEKINHWYRLNFDGLFFEINKDSYPDYKLELCSNNSQFKINLADVGQGISQSLPLIVSSFIERKNETLTIIEQPELHLHPAAHGNLAELFANSIKTTKNKFLIETHSDTFILRLRRLVAENKLDKKDIVIYYVNYDDESYQSNLEKIEIKDNGSVSNWPENIFSESLEETKAIFSLNFKKK